MSDSSKGNALPAEFAGAIIDTTNIASFGDDSSDPLFQVVGAVLTDSVVVIGEQSSGTLRFYRPSGDLLKVSGGRGDGPGEFAMLWWVQGAMEHVFAYDLQLRRVSQFTTDGVFVQSIPIRSTEAYATATALGVFADGSILVDALSNDELSHSPARRRGVVRRSWALLRYDPEGMYIDSVGWFHEIEKYREPFGRVGERTVLVPFGRTSATTVHGEKYYRVDNTDYMISAFDMQGDMVGTLMPPVRPAPAAVTESDIDVLRERFIGEDMPRGSRSERQELFDRLPIPNTFPLYGWSGIRQLEALRVSTGGDVWVLHFGGVRHSSPIWTVFTVDGGVKGQVAGLDEIDVLDARGDAALIHQWDANDVETVHLRRIRW